MKTETFKDYALLITQILGLIAIIITSRQLLQSETELEAIKLGFSDLGLVLFLIYLSLSKK